MRRVITAGLVALTLAAGVSAQDYFQFQRRFQRAPKFATADSFDGVVQLLPAVLHERPQRVRRPGVVDRLPRRRHQLHDPARGADQDARQPGSRRRRPNHLVVARRLARALPVPVRHHRGRRHRAFTDAEVAGLRAYLLKGGFLWSDDFWGTLALENFEAELARVLPETQYQVVDLTPDHPIFRMMFEFDEIPQIPSINHWRRIRRRDVGARLRQRARQPARRSSTRTAG